MASNPETGGSVNEVLYRRFFAWLEDQDADGNALDASENDRLGLRRCWIDMADGNHAGGVMLAQIVYWYLMPSKTTGRSKLTISDADNNKWLAKSYEEWWNECRLTRPQVQRLLNQFTEKGWLITKVKRFKGSPTVHICITWGLLYAWQAVVDTPRESPYDAARQRKLARQKA